MSRPAPSNLLKSSPQKDKKAVHPDMLVKFPQHQGLPHPKTTFQEFVHQVLVRIHPIKLQNPKKRVQKQIATIGKPQINQTKKGSSPNLCSLHRVFHTCKRRHKTKKESLCSSDSYPRSWQCMCSKTKVQAWQASQELKRWKTSKKYGA